MSAFCCNIYYNFILQAINCLIIWAVLFSRPKLAKVLWYRCDEPIPVALICSNMYRELSKCSMELYQRTEMEACAKYV